MALHLVHLDPGPRLHVLQPLSGEAPVVLDLLHREVDAAVLAPVSVAVIDDLLDHGDDIIYALRGLGIGIGAANPEAVNVLEVALDVHR